VKGTGKAREMPASDIVADGQQKQQQEQSKGSEEIRRTRNGSLTITTRVQRHIQSVDAVAAVIGEAVNLMADNAILRKPASADEFVAAQLALRVIPVDPSAGAGGLLHPLILKSI
jgi:hypothetical protein